MRIYGDLGSGNCLKVKYTADHLGLTYEWVPVDITKGESRTAEYLARHPMGQVPALELEDGRCLSQSNAIIRYLARGSRLLPDDPFAQAKVDEWLFWEQNTHEPAVAVCRYVMVYLGEPREARNPGLVERSERALDFMERGLQGREWFAADRMTVADIALLAYTRLAHEGGFDLGSRPRVMEWIGRCEGLLGIAHAIEPTPQPAYASA